MARTGTASGNKRNRVVAVSRIAKKANESRGFT